MKDQNKTMLTPKLRFPEFRDSWEEAPLSALAVPISDRVGMSECVPYTVTSGVGLVSQDKKFGRTIAGKSLGNYIRIQKNDFAYNKSATKAFPEGYIARYLDDVKAAVPNSIFTCFRADLNKIDPAYLDFLFSNNLHGKWLRKFLTIGARAHGSLNVSDDDLMALPVPRPTLAEQRKIAACLTSLDELLAAEGGKLEALRIQRKGLMQQLFPREGESRPSLRFPEFHDAGEWVPRPLSDYFERIRNGFVGTATPFYVPSGVPYLQGKNIKNGSVNPAGLVRISKEFHNKQAKSHLKRDDILMVQSGHVGECATVGTQYEGGNCHALIIMSPRKKVHSPFFVHFFCSSHGKNKIATITTGNTVKHILASDLKAIEVCAPEPDEQQRIAACLSSLDALIAAQSRKMDGLQTHKKGLMQQLFPSAEGM